MVKISCHHLVHSMKNFPLHMKWKDWLLGEGVIFFFSFLWYDDARSIFFLQLLLLPYVYFLKEAEKKKRRRENKKAFYDFLQSLLPSLQAGYSLENACITAYAELKDLYGPKDYFVKLLGKMVYGIEIHISMDRLFHELAERTGDEDIHQFAVVLEILKNMGGNTLEVLRNSMLQIQKKMEVSEEIQTILSGKIYEKNMMLIMPFFMILYLRITNPIYLDPLYHTIPGKIVMSVSLIGIIACFWWSEKIVDLHV